jgi:pyruvate,water dikinase
MKVTRSDAFASGSVSVGKVGGKTFNLLRLVSLGFQVPPFVFLEAKEVEALLADGASEAIKAIKEDCAGFFQPGDFLAVRSSGIAEDGQEQSFAGLFETRLHIRIQDLDVALWEVAASAQSERIRVYQSGKQYSQPVGILIQKMLNPDVSGVAFGRNPIWPDPYRRLVNAVPGLGEGLVSGQVNADTWEFRNGECIRQVAGERTGIVVPHPESGTQWKEVEVVAGLCLNDKQLRQVVEVLDKLETDQGSPQDIEFAFCGEELFLLQTRPITTWNPDWEKTRIIWDNSNIVESYPGVTLPLTYSFIQPLYASVYRQLSALLGIPPYRIEAFKDVYDSLLGHLDGRVYYNLNAWFRCLSLLPGYALNAAFMEKMMGVKESFPIRFPAETSGLRASWEMLLAVKGIVSQFRKARKEKEVFHRNFQMVMETYENQDFAQLHLNELWNRYEAFETTLVKQWNAPLVNDFFAMVFFGLLQKQAEKLAPGENLHNDLLIGSHDIITTQPAIRTQEILSGILQEEGAKQLFISGTVQEIDTGLQRFPRLRMEIDRYIQDWGDRSIAELKLETITYRQDPQAYLQLLKNLLQGKETKALDFSAGSRIRSEAETRLNKALAGKPIKRKLVYWILEQARYFVSNRENLRYERTRGFGMVRRLFLAMGRQLEDQGVLEHHRDVFYFNRQEVKDLCAGTSSGKAREIVAERKAEYQRYESSYLPERMEIWGPPDLSLPHFRQYEAAASGIQSVFWKGLGCCAGRIRGRVRLLNRSDELQSLDGDILLTTSTDPGWVPLFPTCSALLVERGSLLSHAAIVSREMGIPCVVGVSGITRQLKTGDWIELDGASGEVWRISAPEIL